MIITNRKTTTYASKEEGFYIDITEGKECIEAWIYNENYGIKKLMFGIPGRIEDDKRMLEMIIIVSGNEKEYTRIYKEEYMNEWKQ